METLLSTARKLGVNFFQYIRDRVCGARRMPSLAELIKQRAETMDLQFFVGTYVTNPGLLRRYPFGDSAREILNLLLLSLQLLEQFFAAGLAGVPIAINRCACSSWTASSCRRTHPPYSKRSCAICPAKSSGVPELLRMERYWIWRDSWSSPIGPYRRKRKWTRFIGPSRLHTNASTC